MSCSKVLFADSSKDQSYLNFFTFLKCFGDLRTLSALGLGIVLSCLFTVPTRGQGKGAPGGGSSTAPADLISTYKPFDSLIVDPVDTVNTTNGSLTINIPLVSYPQLGNSLKLDFALHYQTPANHSGPDPGPGCRNDLLAFCGPGGWFLIDSGNMTATAVQFTEPPNILATQPSYPLRIQEPSGSAHYLAYDGVAYDSVDASALQFRPSSAALYVSTADGFMIIPGTIVTQDGIVITSASSSAESPIQQELCSDAPMTHADINCESPQRTDRNGNTIKFSQTSGWTDTVGRTIPLPVSVSVSACPSGPQPVTYALQWNFPGYKAGTYPVVICYIGEPEAPLVNFSGTGIPSTLSTSELYPSVGSLIQSVVLPDSTSWGITYAPAAASNGCTTIASLTYPSGATVRYNWTYGCEGSANPFVSNNPTLGSRIENANDGTGDHTWTYLLGNNFYSNPPNPTSTLTETDPLFNDTVYTMTSLVQESSTGSSQLPLGLLANSQIDWYQGTGTSRSLLLSNVHSFLSSGYYSVRYGEAYPGACTINGGGDVGVDPGACGKNYNGYSYTDQGMNGVLLSEQTILPTGITSEIDYSYDSAPWCLKAGTASTCAPLTFGRVTSKKEYDFGQGTKGALLRTTSYTYQDQVNSQYLAAHILDLLKTETIYSGSGAPVSSSTYGYDENNGSPQGVFGNRTSENAWLNTTGGTITNKTIYNTNGMPVQVIDPLENTIKVSYDSTGIFPYQITRPQTGSIQHVEYYTHDATTGVITSHTDENGQVTQYAYNDPLFRMTSVKSAVNTPAESWVTYSYPTLTQVNSAQDQSVKGDGMVKATVITDGFGRPLHSQITSDASGTVYTDIVYDGNGREYTASNQYRSILEPTYGNRTYIYDAIGRPTQQIDSDGVSSRTWTYVGNLVKYNDENNNQWQRHYDAAGRMTSVVEPGSLVTTYSYDALDNLLTVNQLGNAANGDTSRIRSFSYDSFSRLLCTSNPENSTAACPTSGTGTYVAGTVGYSYDADGNEITKTSPAVNTTSGAQTIGYCYDVLNRVTYKFPTSSFSCTSPNGYVASYSYDSSSISGATNVIGRLTDEKSFAGSTLVAERKPYAYDPMGRLLNEQQYTLAGELNGTPYSPAYTYNLAGNLTSSTSGVGPTSTSIPIIFTSNFDGAGRLQTITSNWVDGTHPISLFSAQTTQTTPCSNSLSVPYTAFGGLMNARFGGGLTLNRAYDKRMRTACEIDSGTGAAPATSGSATVTITGAEQSK